MRLSFLAVLTVLLLIPLVASPYQIYVVNTILVACIGAVGLNLLTGFTGQISIGHGAFLGIGAFASALLVARAGAPLWLSVPAAGALTALVGLVFGLPSVRIKGLYLAIATLAAQIIIQWLLSRPMLAGSGSIAAPRPDILHDDRAYYVVVLSVAMVGVLFARNLMRSRMGRAMVAVRDREIAASVIGIDVSRMKLVAFGLSSLYAGVAGALLGHLVRGVNYEQFQLELSVQYLAMIVIGGLGSVRGSILGAIFITLLPIALRSAMSPVESVFSGSASQLLSSTQLFLFGLVIVVCMLLEPSGLDRIVTRVLGKLQRRYQRCSGVAASESRGPAVAEA
jgi:branched-chain amino acid transport system permease protein